MRCSTICSMAFWWRTNWATGSGDWSGRWETLGRWDSELEANRFAIAFGALDPATAAKLEKTVSAFAFIRNGPGQVPPGQDQR